jgi:hypothetical protein
VHAGLAIPAAAKGVEGDVDLPASDPPHAVGNGLVRAQGERSGGPLLSVLPIEERLARGGRGADRGNARCSNRSFLQRGMASIPTTEFLRDEI